MSSSISNDIEHLSDAEMEVRKYAVDAIKGVARASLPWEARCIVSDIKDLECDLHKNDPADEDMIDRVR